MTPPPTHESTSNTPNTDTSDLFSHPSTQKSDHLHLAKLQLSQLSHSIESQHQIHSQLQSLHDAALSKTTKKMHLPLLSSPLCFIQAEYRGAEDSFISLGQGYFQKMSLGAMHQRIQEKMALMHEEQRRLEKQIAKLQQDIFRGTDDIDELFEKLELEEQMELEGRDVDSGDVDEEFEKYYVRNEEAEEELLERMREAEESDEGSEEDAEVQKVAPQQTDLGIMSYGRRAAHKLAATRQWEEEYGDVYEEEDSEEMEDTSTKKRVTFHHNVKDNATHTPHIDLPVPPRNPALVSNIREKKTAPPAMPNAPMDMLNAPIREKSTSAPKIPGVGPSFPGVVAPPTMPGSSAPSFPGAIASRSVAAPPKMPGSAPSFPGVAPPKMPGSVPSFPKAPSMPSASSISSYASDDDEEQDPTQSDAPRKVSRFMQELHGSK